MATLAISMNGDQLRRLASTLQSIAAEMPHPPVTAVVTFDNAPSGGSRFGPITSSSMVARFVRLARHTPR